MAFMVMTIHMVQYFGDLVVPLYWRRGGLSLVTLYGTELQIAELDMLKKRISFTSKAKANGKDYMFHFKVWTWRRWWLFNMSDFAMLRSHTYVSLLLMFLQAIYSLIVSFSVNKHHWVILQWPVSFKTMGTVWPAQNCCDLQEPTRNVSRWFYS